jgi:purine-binding chemotaxis protein CheW
MAVSEIERTEPVIQLRAGGVPLAARLSETQGIVRCPPIVPMPSRVAELLGLAAIRGTVVPVFDLAALLGLSSGANRPSWLMLAGGGGGLIGLAFEVFEGQQSPEWLSGEPPEGSLAADREPSVTGGRAGAQLVRANGLIRQVVNIPALADAIRTRAQVPHRKEPE